MKKLTRLLLPAAIAATLAACGAQEAPAKDTSVSAQQQNIRAHLEFLASDDLKGRQTGSDGHEIASKYIVSEFKQLGLEPAGEDGTYYQRIPFRTSMLKADSAKMVYSANGEELEFEFGKEFIYCFCHIGI